MDAKRMQEAREKLKAANAASLVIARSHWDYSGKIIAFPIEAKIGLFAEDRAHAEDHLPQAAD